MMDYYMAFKKGSGPKWTNKESSLRYSVKWKVHSAEECGLVWIL